MCTYMQKTSDLQSVDQNLSLNRSHQSIFFFILRGTHNSKSKSAPRRWPPWKLKIGKNTYITPNISFKPRCKLSGNRYTLSIILPWLLHTQVNSCTSDIPLTYDPGSSVLLSFHPPEPGCWSHGFPDPS